LQPDLGLAARHQHADAAVRSAGRKLDLGRHLFGDTEAFEHLLDMQRGDAAAGRRGVADRLGVQQRTLQRFRRRHIGMRRALADRKRNPGARHVGSVLDLAFADQRVEFGAADQDHVGELTVAQPSGEAAGRIVAERHLMPGGALKWRHQLLDGGSHGGGDQRLDLGGGRRAGRDQQRGK
jgi:hypothetical protein